MKVVIFCGGRGTRLHEETEYRPKPMMPLGDRPIVWHIMERYRSFGFDDFVLLLGYKGEQIADYFKGNDSVSCIDTGIDTPTAGRLLRVRELLTETFLLTYGDGVGNVSIPRLLAFHKEHGRRLTLTAVHPPGRFGELRIRQGRVTAFNEKPQVSTGRINGGFMVCEPSVMDYCEPDAMLEQSAIPRLVRDGQVSAFAHDGFWQPMDNHGEWLLLNKLSQTRPTPWTV